MTSKYNSNQKKFKDPVNACCRMMNCGGFLGSSPMFVGRVLQINHSFAPFLVEPILFSSSMLEQYTSRLTNVS